MLIITRRAGQSFTITDSRNGETIKIDVLSSTSSGNVRVGIGANKWYQIVRDNAKNREKKD